MSQPHDKFVSEDPSVLMHTTSHGKSTPATNAKTPSKSRVSLGAPANFYFKYMNSSKKATVSAETSFAGSETDTGTISIPGFANDMNTAKDVSLIDLDTSNSSSEADMNNKSTLSDTTDLTASSFVLQATSRQVMRQLASIKKQSSATTSRCAPEDSVANVLSPTVDITSVSPVSHTGGKKAGDVNENLKHTLKITPVGLDTATKQQLNGPTLGLLKGNSPSLRQRLSVGGTTSQDLSKLTSQLKTLKTQQINRQTKERELAGRRLSTNSNASVQSMYAELQSLTATDNHGNNKDTMVACDRQRLPPPFSQPPHSQKVAIRGSMDTSPQQSSTSTVSTTDEIIASMEEIFGSSQVKFIDTEHSPSERQQGKLHLNDSISKLESMTGKHKVSESISSQRVPSMIRFSMSDEQVDTVPSTAEPQFSPSKSEVASSNGRTMARLTPTRLEPSPRRIPNPRALDSPARRTRSSTQKEGRTVIEDTFILGRLSFSSPRPSPSKPSVQAPGKHTKEDDKYVDEMHFIDMRLNKEQEGGCRETGTDNKQDTTIVAKRSTFDIPKQNDDFNENVPCPETPAENSAETKSQSTVTSTEGWEPFPKILTVSEESRWSHFGTEKGSGGDEGNTASIADIGNILDIKTSLENDKPPSAGTTTPESSHRRIRTQSSQSPNSPNSLPADGPPPCEESSPVTDRGKLGGSSMSEESLFSLSKNTSSPNPKSTTTDMASYSTVSGSSLAELSVDFKDSNSDDGADTASITDIVAALGTGSSQPSMDSQNKLENSAIPNSSSLTSEKLLGTSSHSEISDTPGKSSNIELVYSKSVKNIPEPANFTKSPLIRTKNVFASSAVKSLWNSSQHKNEPQVEDASAHPLLVNRSSSSQFSATDEWKDGSIVNDTKPTGSKKVKDHDSPGSKTKKYQDFAPTPSKLDTKSPMRLTPNSHIKPTPTKITASPRRVFNPQHISSPAWNTRSAKKSAFSHVDMSSSQADEKIGEKSPLKRIADGPATELGSTVKKRRHSSINNSHMEAEQDKENSQSPESSLPKKCPPFGILSSTKRKRNPSGLRSAQKSVAFGSPEVALYHVGSPSVSMTPMPSSKAKALFSIPKSDLSNEGLSPSYDCGEQTVEIETDINVLVDKITVANMQESPALSPIAQTRDDTVDLPASYRLRVESMNSHASTTSTSICTPQETTVELEGGMDGLLATMTSEDKETHQTDFGAHGVRRKGTALAIYTPSKSESEQSPLNSSADLTDAQSIAALNSSKQDKFTTNLRLTGAHKLDFSPNRLENDSNYENGDGSMDIDEASTVDLEHGMTGLLAAAGVQDCLARAIEAGGTGNVEPAIEMGEVDAQNQVLNEPLVESKRRRHSQSSSSFTLSPRSSLHISADGSICTDENTGENADVYADGESLNQLEPRTAMPQLYSPDILTVGFNEVFQLSKISPMEMRVEFPLGDNLVLFHDLAGKGHRLVSIKWYQFLEAICAEVEKRTETDRTASGLWEMALQAQSLRFGIFQRRLQSTSDQWVKSQMQRLVSVCKKVVDSEWGSWLAMVVESFGSPLADASHVLCGSLTVASDVAKKYSALQEKMAIFNEKKLRLARRKSMARRQVSWIVKRLCKVLAKVLTFLLFVIGICFFLAR